MMGFIIYKRLRTGTRFITAACYMFCWADCRFGMAFCRFQMKHADFQDDEDRYGTAIYRLKPLKFNLHANFCILSRLGATVVNEVSKGDFKSDKMHWLRIAGRTRRILNGEMNLSGNNHFAVNNGYFSQNRTRCRPDDLFYIRLVIAKYETTIDC